MCLRPSASTLNSLIIRGLEVLRVSLARFTRSRAIAPLVMWLGSATSCCPRLAPLDEVMGQSIRHPFQALLLNGSKCGSQSRSCLQPPRFEGQRLTDLFLLANLASHALLPMGSQAMSGPHWHWQRKCHHEPPHRVCLFVCLFFVSCMHVPPPSARCLTRS